MNRKICLAKANVPVPVPIAPADIKPGQVVEGTRQAMGGVTHAIRLTVAALTHFEEGEAPTNITAVGGGTVLVAPYDWFLIEDVPDPDADLIERVRNLLFDLNGSIIGWHARAEKVVAEIRTTHNITLKEN